MRFVEDQGFDYVNIIISPLRPSQLSVVGTWLPYRSLNAVLNTISTNTGEKGLALDFERRSSAFLWLNSAKPIEQHSIHHRRTPIIIDAFIDQRLESWYTSAPIMLTTLSETLTPIGAFAVLHSACAMMPVSFLLGWPCSEGRCSMSVLILIIRFHYFIM